MKNLDAYPNPNTLVKIKPTESKPEISWYRHASWPEGVYKRFRHYMTMSQNLYEFEFYDEKQTPPHSSP